MDEHRGRLQAQGGRIEQSEAWAQDTPLPATEGFRRLDLLKDRLSPREQEYREKAFDLARRFIIQVAGAGGTGPTKKSYPQPPRRDQRRVDIEVIKGLAFVPEPRADRA